MREEKRKEGRFHHHFFLFFSPQAAISLLVIQPREEEEEKIKHPTFIPSFWGGGGGRELSRLHNWISAFTPLWREKRGKNLILVGKSRSGVTGGGRKWRRKGRKRTCVQYAKVRAYVIRAYIPINLCVRTTYACVRARVARVTLSGVNVLVCV